MTRYINVKLTEEEAHELSFMAGQIADDYVSQVFETGEYDHAGGQTKRECRAGLRALEKLDSAIGFSVKKGR